MVKTIQFMALFVLIASLFGCESADDGPPDCQAGVTAYTARCSPSAAEKQLKMNGCESYKVYASEEGIAKQKERSRAWVTCVQAATTCSAAQACKISE